MASNEGGEVAVSFFRDQFGMDDRSLTRALDAALEREVDYADLYFEYSVQDSVALEEGIVKSGSRHIEQGVGVRTQVAERQGYAHSDDVTVESLELAATTARAISESPSQSHAVAVQAHPLRAVEAQHLRDRRLETAIAARAGVLG